MVGYSFGSKLPYSMFGNPEFPRKPFFVFDKIDCVGEESSVFDCNLAPWGVHGCRQEDILGVVCSHDRENIEPFKLDLNVSETTAATSVIGSFFDSFVDQIPGTVPGYYCP